MYLMVNWISTHRRADLWNEWLRTGVEVLRALRHPNKSKLGPAMRQSPVAVFPLPQLQAEGLSMHCRKSLGESFYLGTSSEGHHLIASVLLGKQNRR